MVQDEDAYVVDLTSLEMETQVCGAQRYWKLEALTGNFQIAPNAAIS